jgi:hypothetical protein
LAKFLKVAHYPICRLSCSINKIQYAYLLTPQGMSEKSKLTLHFLQRKTEEYERLKIEIEQLKRQIG